MSSDPARVVLSPEDIADILLHRQRLPDLPEGWKTTWRWIADGKELTVERHLVGWLSVPGRPDIGVSYGLIVDGTNPYDGCTFTEFGGGGVATVPFAILRGKLWILTTLQRRYLSGDTALDGVPRGYRPEGVSASDHALVEFAEEFGTGAMTVGSRFPLLGEPSLGATHMLDHRPLPNEPKPGGYMFAVRLHESCFERQWRDDRPVLKPGIFAPKDRLEWLAKGCVLTWREAARCQDTVVPVGAIRLMDTLTEQDVRFK